MRRLPTHRSQRAELAACAARAMVDGSAHDFDEARRRALRLTGTVDKRAGPDNLEIHSAMIDYLDLFHRESQAELLACLRAVALKGLRFFAPFEPRLTGPVWYGTANDTTPISLHLFSDETEAVTRFLHDRAIEYHLSEKSFRFPGSAPARRIPIFSVVLGGESFELAVFPNGGNARLALSTLDERPMKRVNERDLETLIASAELFPERRRHAD